MSLISQGVKASKIGFKNLTNSGQSARKGLHPIVKIGAVIIGGIVIYKLAKLLVVSKPKSQEVQQGVTELDKLNERPETKQTITKAQAMSYANSIDTAMQGWGTANTQIGNIFYKLKNDADFLAVSTAFGVREINSGAWNPEPNFKGTMTSCLKSEMSQDWINILNKILIKKKIKYRL